MDATEFKTRYMPFHRMLYTVAYGLAQNQLDAEDLLQELYLRLWKKRDRLPPEAACAEYLSKAMRNLFIEQQRIKHINTTELNPFREPSCDETPESVTQWKETETKLKYAMEVLSTNERKVMEAFVYHDLSYEEIQQGTGLSSTNIRQLVSRARKKLRNLFKV